MIKRNCDICTHEEMKTTPAVADAKTKGGPWAYLCEEHLESYGTGVAGLTIMLKDVK